MLGGLFYCVRQFVPWLKWEILAYCFRKFYVTVPLLSGAEARSCLLSRELLRAGLQWWEVINALGRLVGSASIHTAALFLGFSWVTESQLKCIRTDLPKLWVPRQNHLQCLQPIVHSPSPANWWFPDAAASLSEIETVSAWQGCTEELLQKIKMSQGF